MPDSLLLASLQDACLLVSLTGGAPVGDHRLISGILIRMNHSHIDLSVSRTLFAAEPFFLETGQHNDVLSQIPRLLCRGRVDHSLGLRI